MSACDGTATVHGSRRDADLPVNPFLALRARFGMLLGEDDFLTLMGNGRGKLMLHSAWLHGSGVVHGYRVGVDADTKARKYTLRVSSGLAVDGLGRELYLGGDWCYDLAALVKDLAGEGAVGGCDDERTVEACLSVRLDPCPASPVPALADPCDLSRRHTSESRVVERVQVAVKPGPCPARSPAPYHRLRVLLGLDEAASGDVPGYEAAQEAAQVAELPDGERPAALLEAFHQLAAEDAADLAPFTAEGDDPSLFPQAEPGAVMLAGLRVLVRGYGDDLQVVDYDIDLCGRPTLLPTATIADLVCGLAPALLGSGGARRRRRPAHRPHGRVAAPERPAAARHGPVADRVAGGPPGGGDVAVGARMGP